MLGATIDWEVDRELDEDMIATTFLPGSLFNLILARNSSAEISVIFAVYENSSLLPVVQQPAENGMETVVGTPVLAASVANHTINNLSEPVTLLLRLNDNVSCMDPSVMATFWSDCSTLIVNVLFRSPAGRYQHQVCIIRF